MDTPRHHPRLVLQLQRTGGRGGDCAIIGPDGSDEPPVDRLQVRKLKEENREQARAMERKTGLRCSIVGAGSETSGLV